MRKIIIDTDPGIDDAVALAIAMFSEQLDIQLITAVAGNVGLEHTAPNALRLVSFWGSNVPVAAGADRPLVGAVYNAAQAHGETGLMGFDFEDADARLLPMHAVEAMRRVLMRAQEPITLVPIGPLTNIALLFSMHPEVKEKIDEIVLMGGCYLRGNITPYGEFNIFADPEAADMVLRCGLPIVICPLELGRKALIKGSEVEQLRSVSRTGEMVYSLFSHYRGGDMINGQRMYDSTAIGYLLHPEFYTVKECFAQVEVASELTRGCTVCDIENFWGRSANVRLCTDIDADAFRNWFIAELKKSAGSPCNPTAATWLWGRG